jgi:hypothetical protein
VCSFIRETFSLWFLRFLSDLTVGMSSFKFLFEAPGMLAILETQKFYKNSTEKNFFKKKKIFD